jgi:hypothetical protein
VEEDIHAMVEGHTEATGRTGDNMPQQYEKRRAYRNPKFLASRNVAHDSAAVFILHRLWPGETLSRFTLKVRSHASVTEPKGVEINYKALIVPALDIGFGAIGSEVTDTYADSAATVDNAFRQFIVGPEGDQVDQVYGGSYQNETGAEEAVTGLAQYQYTRKFIDVPFTRESILSPLDPTNAFETFSSNGDKKYFVRQPSLFMFGAYRYDQAGNDEFGMKNWGEIFEDATDRTYFNLMWDPQFIEDQLNNATDVTETMTPAQMKLVQIMLGDNFNETGDHAWSTAEVFVTVKAGLGIQTPIKSSIIGSNPS